MTAPCCHSRLMGIDLQHFDNIRMDLADLQHVVSTVSGGLMQVDKRRAGCEARSHLQVECCNDRIEALGLVLGDRFIMHEAS